MRLAKILLAALLLSGVFSAAGQQSASAEPSDLTTLLCTGALDGCSVKASNDTREGGLAMYYVHGRPYTTVKVRTFKLTVNAGQVVGMTPLNDPTTVTTDKEGIGSAPLIISPFKQQGEAGWALVTLADTKWGDPANIVGQVVPFQARRPTVLGDGYGEQKPVGVTLDLWIANYLYGSAFVVQYQGDDGVWRTLSTEVKYASKDSQSIAVVSYTIPQGLQPKPYRFKLNNLNDKAVADYEWIAIPANNPPKQPRMELLQVKGLGSLISNANVFVGRPSWPIWASNAVLGIVFLAFLVTYPSRLTKKHQLKLIIDDTSDSGARAEKSE